MIFTGLVKLEEVSGLYKWRGICVACGKVVKAPQGIFCEFFVLSDVIIRCAKFSGSLHDRELTQMVFFI